MNLIDDICPGSVQTWNSASAVESSRSDVGKMTVLDTSCQITEFDLRKMKDRCKYLSDLILNSVPEVKLIISDRVSKQARNTNLKSALYLYSHGLYPALDFGHRIFHEPSVYLALRERRPHHVAHS